jgi:Flp pilus assembly protein TadG
MASYIKNILKRFAGETRGTLAIEAVIGIHLLVFIFAAVFTYFDAYRSHAVAEKAAYSVSDMISRETDPITPTYLSNARNIYRDLSGLNDSETALRVTMLRWNENQNRFYIDWSKTRGDTPRLRNADVAFWQEKLPTMVHNERIILLETASDYAPAFKNVGIQPRIIETFVYTRPRFAPQLVWSSDG